MVLRDVRLMRYFRFHNKAFKFQMSTWSSSRLMSQRLIIGLQYHTTPRHAALRSTHQSASARRSAALVSQEEARVLSSVSGIEFTFTQLSRTTWPHRWTHKYKLFCLYHWVQYKGMQIFKTMANDTPGCVNLRRLGRPMYPRNVEPGNHVMETTVSQCTARIGEHPAPREKSIALYPAHHTRTYNFKSFSIIRWSRCGSFLIAYLLPSCFHSAQFLSQAHHKNKTNLLVSYSCENSSCPAILSSMYASWQSRALLLHKLRSRVRTHLRLCSWRSNSRERTVPPDSFQLPQLTAFVCPRCLGASKNPSKYSMLSYPKCRC